jgi:hypothetical protein
MSAPEPSATLAEFTAPPFDVAEGLCGDVAGAGLRMLFAGNQYMALPDLVAGYATANPGTRVYFL